MIDPLSAQDVAAAMEEMLDPETRTEWIARGDRQLERLSDPGIEAAMRAYLVQQAELAREDRS